MYDTTGIRFSSCRIAPPPMGRSPRSHSAKSLVRRLIRVFGYYAFGWPSASVDPGSLTARARVHDDIEESGTRKTCRALDTARPFRNGNTARSEVVAGSPEAAPSVAFSSAMQRRSLVLLDPDSFENQGGCGSSKTAPSQRQIGHLEGQPYRSFGFALCRRTVLGIQTRCVCVSG